MIDNDDLLYEDLVKVGTHWMTRVRAALDREDKWRRDAKEAEEVYLNKGDQEVSFNILHSNVETIVPSIYNSTAAPDIRPRHGSSNELQRLVSDVLERTISTQVDDSALDIEIEACAQDTFVAGRGIVRVKFDADVEAVDGMEVVSGERVVYEAVSWRDYCFGDCARFENRPWEAFRHKVTDAQYKEMCNDDYESLYEEGGWDKDPEDELTMDVWEVWDWETKRVYFVGNDTEKLLDVIDDPLRLEGFFSVPDIIQPITAVADTLPVCPYVIYRDLSDELDRATARIRALVDGCRARAIVAGAASEEVSRLADADDNELVFAANLENLAATGGLDRAILWWPVEENIRVIRELYLQREQTKTAIYEITGISDIIRGQGAASETATAQKIKTQWGGLRIRKMQRSVERMVRSLFKATAEVISIHFTPETISLASGVDLTQQPEVYAAISQGLDHYRIDVESDSTVQADTTKNREEIGAFLQGTSQFFQTMAPLIQQAPQAAMPAIEIYASFARQFNLGKQAEDALNEFVEAAKLSAQEAQSQEPQPDPMAQAAMELKKAELDLKRETQQQRFMIDMLETKLKERSVVVDETEAEIKAAEAEVGAAEKLENIEREDFRI